MRSIFTTKTSRGMGATALGVLVENLQAQINRHGGNFIGSKAASGTFGVSMESMDITTQGEVSSAVNSLSTALESIAPSMADAGMILSATQMKAGMVGGFIGAAPTEFLHHTPRNVALESNSIGTVVQYDGGDSVTARRASLEAYDEKANTSSVVYNIAYNAQAARQDAFGEAFFPTVVVTPDQVGFNISIQLMLVMDEVRRQTSGAVDVFNKKNIIQAVIDPTILRNDQTDIVPVYRDEAAANFIPSTLLTPYTIVNDGESVTTSALAIGKQFSLLGISQTDALLETGLLDNTDSIDPAIRLAAIYMSVTVGATTQLIRFNTKDLPGATFNQAPQGNYRLMSLNFTTESLQISANTKTASGGAATVLNAIIGGGMSVRLGVSIFGTVNTELSTTVLNTSGVNVVRIQDSTGAQLDPTVGTGLTIANLFTNAKIVAYDLKARRTDLNKRQRGQLIDLTYYNQLYAVPLLAPITAVRPLTQAENNDAGDLATLITTTRIRTSNSAVAKLLETGALMNEWVNSKDSVSNTPDILGAARFLVKPFYEETTFDVLASVNSLTSSDRAEDIRAVVINKLRSLVYRMYRDSGYKAAADALAGGETTPPTVIIGTDPVIAQWLMVTGDFRTLGNEFEVKVVTTLNTNMVGKIAVSFGQFNGATEGVPNPMHFGNMAYKPELVTVLPLHRNGANSRELTVSPSYLHVVNLPILAIINITNLNDNAAAANLAVTMHSV